MTATIFQTWYDFNEQPDNDGQPFHITEGDPGGATVYGWTYGMWQRMAPLHGIKDVSEGAFKAQTRATLEPLTRQVYWNGIQGDQMALGIDLFWADFHFGSGGANKVLQAAVGCYVDGVVGIGTLACIAIEKDKQALLDKFLAARLAYYDRCGFQTKWPGLYRRATACHALAVSMLTPPQSPQAQRMPLAA